MRRTWLLPLLLSMLAASAAAQSPTPFEELEGLLEPRWSPRTTPAQRLESSIAVLATDSLAIVHQAVSPDLDNLLLDLETEAEVIPPPADLAELRKRFPKLSALQLIKAVGRGYPDPEQRQFLADCAADGKLGLDERLAAASALVRDLDEDAGRTLAARQQELDKATGERRLGTRLLEMWRAHKRYDKLLDPLGAYVCDRKRLAGEDVRKQVLALLAQRGPWLLEELRWGRRHGFTWREPPPTPATAPAADAAPTDEREPLDQDVYVYSSYPAWCGGPTRREDAELAEAYAAAIARHVEDCPGWSEPWNTYADMPYRLDAFLRPEWPGAGEGDLPDLRRTMGEKKFLGLQAALAARCGKPDWDVLTTAVGRLSSIEGVAVGAAGVEGRFFAFSRIFLSKGDVPLYRRLLSDENVKVRVMGMLCLARDGDRHAGLIRSRLIGRQGMSAYPFGCCGEWFTEGEMARHLLLDPGCLGHGFDPYRRSDPEQEAAAEMAQAVLDIELLARDDCVHLHGVAGESVGALVARHGLRHREDERFKRLRERLSFLQIVKAVGRAAPSAQTHDFLLRVAKDMDAELPARLAAVSALTRSADMETLGPLTQMLRYRHQDWRWRPEWSSSFLGVLDEQADRQYRQQKLAIAADRPVVRRLADRFCTHPMAADDLAEALSDENSKEEGPWHRMAVWLLDISARLPEVAQPWNTYSDAGYRMAAIVQCWPSEMHYQKEVDGEWFVLRCGLQTQLGEKDYDLLARRIVEHIRTCRKLESEPGKLVTPATRPAGAAEPSAE